ncbi:hypothetical protein [Staphylococcus phage vB_ScaM-V1SC01]|nr:hypothetical protein [Staphylococcus phage vB_ScaM-V1SC01]WPF67530.1 hypothetical protein [Staphylococcus phage vB_SauM-V1SA12]
MLRYLVVLLYINYNILYTPCQVNFKKIIEVGTRTYFYLTYIRMFTLLLFILENNVRKKTVMCKVFVLLLITL